MENTGWILLVFLAFQLFIASSLDIEGWWNIDCGSENSRVGNDLLVWETDEGYTQTGTSMRLSQNQSLEEMNTLRFFPNKAQQNCYNVPAYPQILRYLIRAGFYYGNYDGLSRPPTFDLLIDGKKWSTVNTSSTRGQPIYHEAIYVTRGSGYLKMCLVQTRLGEVPFISSIEVVPLSDNLYPQMETNATFLLVTRTNLGGDEIRSDVLQTDEMYNRIWTRGTTPSNCIEIDTIPDLNSKIENNPPIDVLFDSIQSNTSDPIILTVDFPQLTPQPAYFVFYFTENLFPSESTGHRIIKININGQNEETVVGPDFGKCKVITMYPVTVVGPTINITLGPANESTLPPLIAAMEVFTRSDFKAYGGSKSGATRKHFFSMYMLVHVTILVAVLLV